ncbi:metallophosphoesterase, partial [Azospirillum sp. INR13]|nr:metallophosphoesterase [Azospirillum sp. INR13]
MKIALISDIHANLEALQATFDAMRAEGVERIVCLGDIVGYNTDAAACIALLRQAGAVCIAGNHDRAVTGAIGTEGFSGPAARAVDWTRRRLDE